MRSKRSAGRKGETRNQKPEKSGQKRNPPFLVPAFWFLLSGFWFLVSGFWFLGGNVDEAADHVQKLLAGERLAQPRIRTRNGEQGFLGAFREVGNENDRNVLR